MAERIIVETAKLMAKGQVTIPLEIRKRLGVPIGDNVLFISSEEGVRLVNPVAYALKEMQEAMRGEAEKVGIQSDEDVVSLVNQVRKERRK
jgi:antitoxin PrlF